MLFRRALCKVADVNFYVNKALLLLLLLLLLLVLYPYRSYKHGNL